jgi:hypothetical protein
LQDWNLVRTEFVRAVKDHRGIAIGHRVPEQPAFAATADAG